MDVATPSDGLAVPGPLAEPRTTTERTADDGKLGGALEKRVKALVDDAVSTRMQGRMKGRLDRSLDELGIELTRDQRKKLDAAMAERVESMREIRRTGRESGLSREEMGEQIAKVSSTFTEKLSTFLPAADAQAITAATSGGPGGPGGGGGPRRGGGPGG